MEKPDYFLLEVWEKMTITEQKEIYLTELMFSEFIPPYIKGIIRESKVNVDKKVSLLEKIIKGEPPTDEEIKLFELDTIAD